MKRDLIVFMTGIALMLISGLFAAQSIVPVFSPVSEVHGPTLILDAGHGGEDGGASSASGHKESTINLSIVLKLESLMAFLGQNTVLTRREDISIHDKECNTLRDKKVSDLKNRVSLIQDTPNAMLISVHQNTFTDSRYQGAQVFSGAGEISDQWGIYTQEVLRTVLNPANNRKAAPVPGHVYLFSKIDCPALLIECGFLSNGEEAALLLTDSYQCKIAMALAGAYFHELQMIPSPLGGE